MFNAINYTQELQKAGFSREQAEASIKLLIDVMNENFATKSDLQSGIALVRSEMSLVRSDLKSEIELLRSDFKSEIGDVRSGMRELEYRLTIKLGTFMALSIGLTATLVKLL